MAPSRTRAPARSQYQHGDDVIAFEDDAPLEALIRSIKASNLATPGGPYPAVPASA